MMECEARPAAAEVDAAFFSPYPQLAKHASTTRERTQQNRRAKTWKELLKERENVFYVKSLERVCDLARLDQGAIEAFCARAAAGDGSAAWLFGRRDNRTVEVEVIHAMGADDEGAFALAESLGLETVGCAFFRSERDPDATGFLLTAREVATASFLQYEAMKREANVSRPYPFATLVVSSDGDLNSEAFEASELAVQMAAEAVLAPPDVQGSDASDFVNTTEDVVVDRKDVAAVDPRFLYRAVPVAALDRVGKG